MAVPFCVPKKSKVQPPKSTTTTANNNEAAKILQCQFIAQALCNALREYYLQSLLTKDGFISGSVEVLPNGKLKPIRK